MNWLNNYIGIPWVNGGRSIDGFDCWGLLWHIYQEYFDLKIECHPTHDASQISKNKALFMSEKRAWQRVEHPKNGDAVAMATGRAVHHVGIWLNVDGGMILHTMESTGCVLQTIPALQSRGFNLKFFRKS